MVPGAFLHTTTSPVNTATALQDSVHITVPLLFVESATRASDDAILPPTAASVTSVQYKQCCARLQIE